MNNIRVKYLKVKSDKNCLNRISMQLIVPAGRNGNGGGRSNIGLLVVLVLDTYL